MFGFDARTRALLDAVARHGTVAAAARAVGMDPSNARRHLRAAETRRGATLVASARGGAIRGTSRLTGAGRRVTRAGAGWSGRAGAYDARAGVTPVQVGARTLHAAGRLPVGPVRVSFRPEDVTLERRAAPTSARNAIPAQVDRIDAVEEGTFRVVLIAGALRFEALLTRGAVRELRLRAGSRVVARMKATALLVEAL